MFLQDVVTDRLHRARAGGHSDDLHPDRAFDLAFPASCVRPRDEAIRLEGRPSPGRRPFEEIVRGRPHLRGGGVIVPLQEGAGDRVDEFLEALDRLPDGPIDDLVDRLEIPGEVRTFLVRREVHEDVEGGRERHGSIRTSDLDRLDDARHPDLVQPERVRDLLSLYVLRDGIDPLRSYGPVGLKLAGLRPGGLSISRGGSGSR